MAAGSVPCSECGQPVPAHRLSCASCGAPVRAGSAPAIGDEPVDASPTLETAPATPGEAAAAPVVPAAAAPAAPAALGEAGSAPAAPAAPGGPGGLVPGAYLPPSSVHRPEPAPPPGPQMPLAASPSVGAPPPAPPPHSWVPIAAPPPPPAGSQLRPGRASFFADLPFDAPDTVSEWLVAVGSGIAAISFLLPWVSGTVSYDTSWGLASVSRLPILAILIVTAVLGILPNGVALWVRSGVLAIVGGCLFLGVLWPIVAGEFGDAAFGAVIGAGAAVVLTIGGIVGVAPRSAAATGQR